VFQAFSSLGGTDSQMLRHHPTVAAVAEKHACTPSQVLLRWAVQHDVCIVPKSSNPAHIAANLHVESLTLDAAAMEELDNLEGAQGTQHFTWSAQSDSVC